MQMEELKTLTVEEWMEKLGIIDEGDIVPEIDLMADDADERRD